MACNWRPGAEMIWQRQIVDVLIGHFGIGSLISKEEFLDALKVVAAIDHADADIIELKGRHQTQRLRDEKGLTIEKCGAHKAGAINGVAPLGPGAIAGEDVDGLGLQRRKTGLATQGAEFDQIGITEHGRGNGAAEIDIKPGPAPFSVFLGKAWQRIGGTANQETALAHSVEGLGRNGRRRHGQQAAKHGQKRWQTQKK